MAICVGFGLTRQRERAFFLPHLFTTFVHEQDKKIQIF